LRKRLALLNANTLGILCLVGALGCLTISDSIIKWVSDEMPLHQITFWRSCFAMLAVLVIVQFEGGMVRLKTSRPALHLLRGSMLVLANMFFFVGLAAMRCFTRPHCSSAYCRNRYSVKKSACDAGLSSSSEC